MLLLGTLAAIVAALAAFDISAARFGAAGRAAAPLHLTHTSDEAARPRRSVTSIHSARCNEATR